MARRIEIYLCTACDGVAPQWVGRCPHCGQWNTLTTSGPRRAGRPAPASGSSGALAVSLRQVDGGGAQPMPTGVVEVDRVLGGGFVPGSVTLVFGPPGVGKSTLLFQVLASVAATGAEVLLASAEESLSQVSGRATRIGAVPENLLALAGPDVVAIEAAIVRHHPALVVVDSIQTVSDDELPGSAGSLAQVRACVDRLTRLAKSTGVPVVLVGHVTKDGDLAGPRAVEHLVDTVLSFDGDRHHSLRVLTAVKHRFGPAGEVGIFEMRDDGLRAVPDPGPMLLGDRMAGIPGSVVVPVLQGRRPLLVEVQALLGPSAGGTRPRTLGIDAARVTLLLAVLEPPHGGRGRGGRGVRGRRRWHQHHRAGGRPGCGPRRGIGGRGAGGPVRPRRLRRAGAGRGGPDGARRRSPPGRGLASRVHQGPRASVHARRRLPARHGCGAGAYARRSTGQYHALVVDRGSQPLNDALAR